MLRCHRKYQMARLLVKVACRDDVVQRKVGKASSLQVGDNGRHRRGVVGRAVQVERHELTDFGLNRLTIEIFPLFRFPFILVPIFGRCIDVYFAGVLVRRQDVAADVGCERVVSPCRIPKTQ